MPPWTPAWRRRATRSESRPGCRRASPAARTCSRSTPWNSRARALGVAVAGAVGAGLGHVSAGLHAAPLGGAVLRPVIEGPAAGVLGAGLEPLPASVLCGLGDRRHQPRDGPVHAGGVRLEPGLPGLEAQVHACAAGGSVEALDRRLVEGVSAVDEEERAQALADPPPPARVALAPLIVGADQVALHEPLLERFR